MSSKVYVIGVGMTKFEKPGREGAADYPAMAKESGTKALADAGVAFDQIEQAHVGFMYGESTSGPTVVHAPEPSAPASNRASASLQAAGSRRAKPPSAAAGRSSVRGPNRSSRRPSPASISA